jgi:hypothetical protein
MQLPIPESTLQQAIHSLNIKDFSQATIREVLAVGLFYRAMRRLVISTKPACGRAEKSPV